ncbi:MAG: hypothetical protein IJ511_04430 [Bacteroides sp.]|nr:hypothetical protein [Bacteroides sp.]
MEKMIIQTDRRLKLAYVLFWLLAVAIVVAGECWGERWTGCWAGDVQATYYAEFAVILLTAICTYGALKLFSWVLTGTIDRQSLPQALRTYGRFALIRLAMLALPVVCGGVVYYLAFSTTGMYCALIGLTASLFCLPGEERMRRDLHIYKEEGGPEA